jgi:acetyltransferase-like isoleucine patch superfamily enzyme
MATDDDLGSVDVAREQVEAEPWFAVWSDGGDWPGQAERRADVVARTGATLGERVFLAEGATIACESLVVGDRTYVATGCVLRDRLELGDDCSLNPYVVMAGRVRLGNGVRVASFAALYGFNHVMDDVEVPIWLQGLTEDGIVVEDDVWIGTHAVICDGVTVGAHSVVAAGAVVTADVPPYAVVGGVPARVLSDRRDRSASRAPRRGGVLERFGTTVADEWPLVLERCRVAGRDAPGGYTDVPGGPDAVRPTCDAVEIAAAFGDRDGAGDRDRLVAWLQDRQDPASGLFTDPAEPPLGIDPLALRLDSEFRHYGVLSVGYALEVLGAAPRHPVHCVEQPSSDELVGRLDALPWRDLAWPAGSWVDFWGTAVHLNRRHHGSTRGLEALFGWLATRVDRRSGLWGEPNDAWGWLMPVNGFYRLTRGTYAQFGEPLPHPEAVIDTVAAHGRDHGWFRERGRSACNVLDVVHPLWLCARQSDHRRAELRDVAAAMLDDAVGHWEHGAGFAFQPGAPAGLQGTEMWLSIVYLLADLLGESAGLPWSPRGVHRPEPAGSVHRRAGFDHHGGP